MTFDVMNCQLPTSVLTIWLQVIYLPDLKMKCMEFVCIETKTFAKVWGVYQIIPILVRCNI